MHQQYPDRVRHRLWLQRRCAAGADGAQPEPMAYATQTTNTAAGQGANGRRTRSSATPNASSTARSGDPLLTTHRKKMYILAQCGAACRRAAPSRVPERTGVTRALAVCSEPGCPNLTLKGTCPIHARPAWRNSTRGQRLPADWDKTRLRILIRDRHTCQLGYPGCMHTATDVDHIRHGDDHHDRNLQAACNPCHRTKSSREGGRAAYAKRVHDHA